MDNMPDLSALASSDSGIGDMIGKLMARPDLIQNIASELGLSSPDSSVEQQTERKEPNAAIPTSAPSPIGSGDLGKKGKTSDKERLLLALKPYLSDKRRDAIDMMLKLDSLTSLMGSINPDIIKTLLGGGGNV